MFSHSPVKTGGLSVIGYLFPAFSWLVTYCSRPASSMGYFLNTAPHRLARPRDRVTWHHHMTAHSREPLAENIDNRGTYSAARRRWWCRRVSSSPSPDWPEPRWCNLIGRLRRKVQQKNTMPSFQYVCDATILFYYTLALTHEYILHTLLSPLELLYPVQ